MKNNGKSANSLFWRSDQKNIIFFIIASVFLDFLKEELKIKKKLRNLF